MMNLFVSSVFLQALLLYTANAHPGHGPAVDRNTPYDLSNNSLLPTECGKDFSERIYGGNRTNMGEYPWMVLLEYENSNGISTECGGSLISKRYVLTAAHCLRSELKNVRLGEDDTETNPDCRQDENASMVCADEVIKVGVEAQITHENYQRATRDQWHDIALLRLTRDVPFTNYVKPICLPSNGSIGKKLFAAGWGMTENGTVSNVKLKVSLPYVEMGVCQEKYDEIGVILNDRQVCAGGQTGKDTCNGDSGGPLMDFKITQEGTGKWSVIGVTSFGRAPCGMPGWPGVYTKVSEFVPWILSKMRP